MITGHHTRLATLLSSHQPPLSTFFLFRKFLGLPTTFSDPDDSTRSPDHFHHQTRLPPQPPTYSVDDQNDIASTGYRAQEVLKLFSNSSDKELGQALQGCGISPSLLDDTVLEVLRRHNSDWKPAFRFFNWVSGSISASGYCPGPDVCDQMLDILGKMRRFDEVKRLLDQMSERKGLISERTFAILVHRYAASHNVEEAINTFYNMSELGLKRDLAAFNELLLYLCRYKHVEEAEYLFLSKKDEFRFHYDIKTWNIILNGWCILRNLRESKRIWKEIIRSGYKPDIFTYGIFINSLCKSGKTTTALELFNKMWEEGCYPDVAICNTLIDGLCFKKRIPEAFKVFEKMKRRDCLPNAATFNTIIKYLCKIQRIEKAYEILSEMEKGGCQPNCRTYSYLLKSVKGHLEVPAILTRMETHGCKMNCDMYNLLLRLYVKWGCEERVQSTWVEMEKDGQGPDQRSYTVVIHWLCYKERADEAMRYFEEMKSKGMLPESRTKILIEKMKLNEKVAGSARIGN